MSCQREPWCGTEVHTALRIRHNGLARLARKAVRERNYKGAPATRHHKSLAHEKPSGRCVLALRCGGLRPSDPVYLIREWLC
jgi:hypothetical protein